LAWAKQKPGMSTILNALIIAFMVDFSLVLLPSPETLFWQLLQAVIGVGVIGLASGIYLTANLGADPRDGLLKAAAAPAYTWFQKNVKDGEKWFKLLSSEAEKAVDAAYAADVN